MSEAKPKLHDFVRHKRCGLKAQVYKHFVDVDDYVGVIVLPQPGGESPQHSRTMACR